MSPKNLTEIATKIKRLQRDFKCKPEINDAIAHKHVSALEKGSILFYNSREVKVGTTNIDWSGAHIDHQEWSSHLNRFYYLPHLTALYKKNGKESYPKLAKTNIKDWINAHSYGKDQKIAPGDNTLNLSIRLGQSTGNGWWPAASCFAKSKHWDTDFIQSMIQSTRDQLALLRENMTLDGNWRISQLDTLLFCSLILPDMDDHLQFAVRNLNETFHRQINPDGSHEEHNPSYHQWMCNVFTSFWRLSKARPELGLSIETERVLRMWDYTVCSTAPDGGSVGLHDGEPWSPGDGISSLIKKRSQILKESNVQGKKWDLSSLPSRYFKDAGQLFLRTGFKPHDTMILFDASRWGGAHSHLSRNSISLYSKGRMLLCDPGIFSYEMSDPFAVYGKSTPSHNTINIDSMSQSEVNPDTTTVEIFNDVAVMHSRYGGGYYPGTYTWNWLEGRHPGTFAQHGRILVWLSGRCALVFDDLKVDRTGQRYSSHWQLPAGKSKCDPLTHKAWSISNKSNILVHLLSASDNINMSIIEGQSTTIRGWLPTDSMGGKTPAPQITFEGNTSGLHSTLSTLLLPFEGKKAPEITCTRIASTPADIEGYNLTWEDGEEDIITLSHGLKRQIDTSGDIQTDASLAVVSIRKNKPWRVVIIGGMYLKYKGKILLDKKKAGNYRKELLCKK